MSETAEQKLSRVQTMAEDDGGTWDLSPKDQAALRHVLDLMQFLAEENAALVGCPIERVIDRAHGVVESGK